MLIHNAEVDGTLCDVRISGKVIVDICPMLDRQEGEQFIEAQGGALLPGLHDHHIHLQATAAAMMSVRCGPPEVTDLDTLAEKLRQVPGEGWIRGVGYHDMIGRIDRAWLDTNAPDRPIRIQHRGGRMWVLNSQAIDMLDIVAPPDGRLIDRDRELREKSGAVRPDLCPLVDTLVESGITGVTDTTPGNDPADCEHLSRHCGQLRLVAMGGHDLNRCSPDPRASIGPLKLHYHDHDLPALDHLAREIGMAHSQGRKAAMHCVTHAEIMLALAAFEEAGPEPGDRIEHAAIADDFIVDWIARLGLTVVTQPHFISQRAAAYRNEVDASELAHLWPLKRFFDAGIPIAAGSDSPFEGFDPWQAMASAVTRPSDLSPSEAITPEQALQLYTKPADDAGAQARRVATGETADLCLLDRNWSAARDDLSSVKVVATWLDGELAYDTISSTRPHSSAA